jgi:hypothetical protein
VIAYTATVFSGTPLRTLVLEADAADELEGLVARALEKGWRELASGTVPGTAKLGTWLVKPDTQGASGA